MSDSAVVFAGGLGTRLAPVLGDVLPKVMVPIGDRPFLDYKLAHLAAQGMRHVILLVGHRAEVIRDHVGPRRFGMSVTYVEDGPVLLGTGGALRRALGVLPETFLATYGDSYLPVDLQAVIRDHVAFGASATMTVQRNDDRGGLSNVRIESGLVTDYDKQVAPGTFQHIDYGLLLLSKSDVAGLPAGREADLALLFDDLIARRQLHAVEVVEPFFEVGTPERLERTRRYLLDGDVWSTLAPDEAVR